MRAVLVGAVESSLVALERISKAAGWTLALVLTLPPEKSGRHSDFVELSAAARSAGCEIRFVDNINSEDSIRAVQGSNADYVFVVGWSQICGSRFRAACNDRVIGYHPAPLPRMRGRAVIPWTILNQEPITAGTLFWIDEGVDSGPILAQEFFHVARDETAASLYRRHMEALARMIDCALGALQSPLPPRMGQEERFATWAARRMPADSLIDWGCPAVEIERLIRAVGGPYPPAFTFEGAHRIEIRAARLQRDGPWFVASCGQVVSSNESAFAVKCGDGETLTITDWAHPALRPPKLHVILAGTETAPSVTLSASPASPGGCRSEQEVLHV